MRGKSARVEPGRNGVCVIDVIVEVLEMAEETLRVCVFVCVFV